MKRHDWLLGKGACVVFCHACGYGKGVCYCPTHIVASPFEITTSSSTVLTHNIGRRRFNVIDRAQQKARQEIQAQEDAMLFRALDFSNTIVPPPEGNNEEN